MFLPNLPRSIAHKAMENPQRLTLTAMAKRLNFTPKTFKKYVTSLRIPHLKFGNTLRFDPVEVEARFRVVPDTPKPIIRRKPATNTPGRFAERLGL